MPKNSIADITNQKLTFSIVKEIEQSGGRISFARYMELVLYAPGLGYYSAGKTKLGSAGDFVTAPEIAPLFAQCIARQCQQVLTVIQPAAILELGAGSGKMAADLLLTLAKLAMLPERYLILEISADLKQQQQQIIAQLCPKEIYQRVQWLEQLPDNFSGIILANEVLDAMPVTCFRINRQQLQEAYVTYHDNKFHRIWDVPTTSDLEETVKPILAEYLLTTSDYSSEINLWLPAWLKSLSCCLEQGLMLFIDYGYPRHEYYHPERISGTLICHYRHHAHPDPFIHIGLQDITAHVDFTGLAEAAFAANLDVIGYTDQASFLVNCGLADLVKTSDPIQQYQLNQAIKRLTLPHEMGELFKVMALGKNLDISLCGFTHNDKRMKL